MVFLVTIKVNQKNRFSIYRDIIIQEKRGHLGETPPRAIKPLRMSVGSLARVVYGFKLWIRLSYLPPGDYLNSWESDTHLDLDGPTDGSCDPNAWNALALGFAQSISH